MGLWENLVNTVRGHRNDEYDEVEVGVDGTLKEVNHQFDSFDEGIASSKKVMRLAEKDSRTHKIVKIRGTGTIDFNNKRKEAADYFKDGHVVYLNMDEASKAIMSPVLNFLGGMAYALDGELKRLSTNVYAMIPAGDDIGGDLYGDEDSAEYHVNDSFMI